MIIKHHLRSLISSLLIIELVLGCFGRCAYAYDWTCNLFCYNNGVCRHGHGKFGSYAGIESGIEELPFEQELHETGMYCTCPEGYTGLQCEIKYVTCGKDNHTCFNGSSCIKERSSDNGNIFYRCECDATASVMDAPYAGKYCEHIATVFCDEAKKEGASHSSSFCTNGGKCRSASSGATSVGCDCPKGWEGKHCEIKVKTPSTPIIREIENYISAGEIVAILLAVSVGATILAYIRNNCFGTRGQHRTRGTDRRRALKKTQEMKPFRDARDSTGDII